MTPNLSITPPTFTTETNFGLYAGSESRSMLYIIEMNERAKLSATLWLENHPRNYLPGVCSSLLRRQLHEACRSRVWKPFVFEYTHRL